VRSGCCGNVEFHFLPELGNTGDLIDKGHLAGLDVFEDQMMCCGKECICLYIETEPVAHRNIQQRRENCVIYNAEEIIIRGRRIEVVPMRGRIEINVVPDPENERPVLRWELFAFQAFPEGVDGGVCKISVIVRVNVP